jgi:hypothetical protein
MIGSVAIPVILFLSLAEAEPARRSGRRVRGPKPCGFRGTLIQKWCLRLADAIFVTAKTLLTRPST